MVATASSVPSSPCIKTFSMRQVQAVSRTESPFTFRQQVVMHSGQRWECDVVLPPMTHAQARVWIGFLSALRGSAGTFKMGDPAGATPIGSAGGSPKIDGASQTGTEIDIDGCTTSQTGWLKAGDYVEIGNQLYMATEDIDTNALGQATLVLWPDVRTAFADNAVVTVSGAEGTWRLNSPTLEWDYNHLRHYGIRFSAVEVVS